MNEPTDTTPKRRRRGKLLWLTFSNWLLVERGIVRRYLEEREAYGRLRARQEQRREFPTSWKLNARLNSWAFLDSWPACPFNVEVSLQLFCAGYEAWRHVRERDPSPTDWTPERLMEWGDKLQAKAYREELAVIAAAQAEITNPKSESGGEAVAA